MLFYNDNNVKELMNLIKSKEKEIVNINVIIQEHNKQVSKIRKEINDIRKNIKNFGTFNIRKKLEKILKRTIPNNIILKYNKESNHINIKIYAQNRFGVNICLIYEINIFSDEPTFKFYKVKRYNHITKSCTYRFYRSDKDLLRYLKSVFFGVKGIIESNKKLMI